jgi:hypothetical protein
LTAFTFHITRESTGFLGKKLKAKQQPYILLSIDECKAWAEELKRRKGFRPENQDALRQVAVEDEPRSKREIKEAEEFVQIDPKDRKNKNVEYSNPAMSREEIRDCINVMVRQVVEEVLGKVLPGKLGEKHRERAEHGMLVKKGKSKKLKWKV